ncbi:11699_t:CDS:2 [Ambispora gerdemannii]|uniref:11699_t:CDS:1 n=1 Tax=Ambispora gerdemannii TaxID=144530 RepID=A0A9N9FXN0_9GLOM|nr:11699_t:CDS:2 [Ambispora gerdemannii]
MPRDIKKNSNAKDSKSYIKNYMRDNQLKHEVSLDNFPKLLHLTTSFQGEIIFHRHIEIPEAIQIFNNIQDKKPKLGKSPNPFLIFRTSIQTLCKDSKLERHHVSSIASAAWKNSSEDIKDCFKDLFEEVKILIANAKKTTDSVQVFLYENAVGSSTLTNYYSCDNCFSTFLDLTKHHYSYEHCTKNIPVPPLSQPILSENPTFLYSHEPMQVPSTPIFTKYM